MRVVRQTDTQQEISTRIFYIYLHFSLNIQRLNEMIKSTSLQTKFALHESRAMVPSLTPTAWNRFLFCRLETFYIFCQFLAVTGSLSSNWLSCVLCNWSLAWVHLTFKQVNQINQSEAEKLESIALQSTIVLNKTLNFFWGLFTFSWRDLRAIEIIKLSSKLNWMNDRNTRIGYQADSKRQNYWWVKRFIVNLLIMKTSFSPTSVFDPYRMRFCSRQKGKRIQSPF